MTTLKICNDEWETSVTVARRFVKEYPDNVGLHYGVVFSVKGYKSFYVYRTQTGTIVVK